MSIARPIVPIRNYTGIGSRTTPPPILQLMTEIAHELREAGYTLRSGGATGADQAFGRGALANAVIYLPWSDFGVVEEGALPVALGNSLPADLHRIAFELHPHWNDLKIGAKKLHARNVRQVIGISLKEPSDFLICWTPEGRTVGGTATALKLAAHRDVPIFNLADPQLARAFRDRHVLDVLTPLDRGDDDLPMVQRWRRNLMPDWAPF